VLSLAGSWGVFLLYTRIVFGHRDLLTSVGTARWRRRSNDWLTQAGLEGMNWRDFALACSLLFVIGTGLTYAVFAGWTPAVLGGLFAAAAPPAAYRRRRRNRLADAQQAWPRMIEEIRVLIGSSGASIPQALFEVGSRSPEALRSAFGRAHREWLLSTDFERAVSTLKGALAHPTADVALETLLAAYEVGGVDLDPRLADLAEDRMAELQGRKDARARQAGARFARAFVIAVPLGMALMGLSIGNGRASFRTGGGQVAVVLGLLVMVGCWLWAGRLMTLPDGRRVFAE